MSDMYVITATSVHCSDVANVMQLYMYCNSTLYNDKIRIRIRIRMILFR